jgi:hypothetical protein
MNISNASIQFNPKSGEFKTIWRQLEFYQPVFMVLFLRTKNWKEISIWIQQATLAIS